MSKNFLSAMVIAISAIFLFCGTAIAAPVEMESLYGDIDGAGRAWTPPASGQSFNFFSIPGYLGGEDITDQWVIVHSFDPLSWSQPGFSLDFLPQSATLEIAHGGFGVNGPPTLLFEGSEVGQLSVGENFARVDLFDLSGFLDRLVAQTLNLSIAVSPGYFGDGGVVDYVNILARGEMQQQSSPVPEPATILLLATGLIFLVPYGRRKLKKS